MEFFKKDLLIVNASTFYFSSSQITVVFFIVSFLLTITWYAPPPKKGGKGVEISENLLERVKDFDFVREGLYFFLGWGRVTLPRSRGIRELWGD